MKFFIDTAQLDEIQQAASLGILDGVTTNPTLMSKLGIQGKENIFAHYKAICALVEGDVSAEVLSITEKEMIAEGIELAKIHPNIVVNGPMTKDGLKARRYFTDHNINTKCTLVFSAAQALLAAKAGATYVSPFVGRLDDISSDGLHLIAEIKQIYTQYQFKTKILAASIRHAMHIVDCAKLGADVMTSGLPVILSLFNHPMTNLGLAQFIDDAKKITV